MDIRKIFDKIPTPKVYNNNGKSVYYDPYRNIFLPSTPEELIRQKTAVYLEQYLDVPHGNIETEVHLHRYEGVEENGRIDIVIDAINENNQRKTLAIVECKAASVPLTAQTVGQACRYADAVLCGYVILTNGSELFQFRYDNEKKTYVLLDGAVNYGNMLIGAGEADHPHTFRRCTAEELFNIDFIKKDGLINGYAGEDTPEELIPYIANIFDALRDMSHSIPQSKNNFFEITEDLGCYFLGYGDASGGTFGTGTYRSVMIDDYKKGNRIINIGIMSTGKSINDPVYGNRESKSVLVVSVSDNEHDEMALQLDLNKFLTVRDNVFYLTHNGAVMKKGARSEELKRRLYAADENMIKGGKIFLGKCPGDRPLYADTPEFTEIINHIILYALIRDEYKNELSK